MEMLPGHNEPKLLVLRGSVDARTDTGAKGSRGGEATAGETGDTRRLTTDELRLTFLEKGLENGLEKGNTKGTKLASADTDGRGTNRMERSGECEHETVTDGAASQPIGNDI